MSLRESNIGIRNTSSSKSTTDMSDIDEYNSIRYWVTNKVANIQLNRPARYNAIDMHMPLELEQAVENANLDPNVKVGLF